MSEFDQFAYQYQSILDDSLSLFGGFNDYYLLKKVDLIKKNTKQINIQSILDFGCGLGKTSSMLKNLFIESRVVGMDISELSLNRARQHSPNVEFGCVSDKAFMDSCVNAFDIIYIANVFHHISPEKRSNIINLLKSMLKNNGEIFFFEHNPYNPITRFIVSRCKFDKNAILLSPQESRVLFENAGFNLQKTYYLIFFSYKLRCISNLEFLLSWLPIGAQYSIFLTKK